MPRLDPYDQFSEKLQGAAKSIEVLASGSIDPDLLRILHTVAQTSKGNSQELLRRALIFADKGSISEFKRLTETLIGNGWKIRIIPRPENKFQNERLSFDCIIIDRKRAWMIGRDDRDDVVTGSLHDFNHTQIATEFDKEWGDAIGINDLGLLYKSPFENLPLAEEVALIKVYDNTWNQIIPDLNKNKEKLYQLDPRKFEELVAELLRKEGSEEVRLTPQSKDGGRDIMAINRTTLGTYMTYVQCKRYAEHRAVGVGVIRELHGVVVSERATAGLVVTTSYFSREAKEFANNIKYQMGLRDYEELVKWIERATKK